MAQLAIFLLGCFHVTLDGRPLTKFVSDKGRALLAYLAVEAERPHRRETLAGMLWPDQPEAVSRANLRQTLHRLRELIGDPYSPSPYIVIESQELQFNRQNSYWLDVCEFTQSFTIYERQRSDGMPLSEDCLASLQSAIDLYQGDLLSGFSLSGCSGFEWWLLCKREKYHCQSLEMLERLFLGYEQRRDYRLASQYAQRAIELEPWNENAHRQKMHALALGGQRTAALHQYQVCRQILTAELGVEPSAETTRLFQQIRDWTPQASLAEP